MVESKQITRFVYTFHFTEKSECVLPSNDVRQDVELVENKVKEILTSIQTLGPVKYHIVGAEMGLSGQTPHLQGFCQLTSRVTLRKVKLALPHAFVQQAYGSAYKNNIYVNKEGVKVWEYGDKAIVKESVQKVDYDRVLHLVRSGRLDQLERELPQVFLNRLSAVRQLASESYIPDSYLRRGFWLVGSPGTGKTRFAYNISTPNNVFIKDPSKWFDHYTEQEFLLIEEVDKRNGKDNSYLLKRMADHYPLLGERKGGYLYLRHKTAIVTSNYRISDIWDDDVPCAMAMHRRYKEIVVLDHTVEEKDGQTYVRIKTVQTGSGLPEFVWLDKDTIFSY